MTLKTLRGVSLIVEPLEIDPASVVAKFYESIALQSETGVLGKSKAQDSKDKGAARSFIEQ